jgi:hypothetical protein
VVTVHTSKNQNDPDEDDIPTLYLTPIGLREPHRRRSCQYAYRKELKSTINVHVNRAINMRCGQNYAMKSRHSRKEERGRETSIAYPRLSSRENASRNERIVQYPRSWPVLTAHRESADNVDGLWSGLLWQICGLVDRALSEGEKTGDRLNHRHSLASRSISDATT